MAEKLFGVSDISLIILTVRGGNLQIVTNWLPFFFNKSCIWLCLIIVYNYYLLSPAVAVEAAIGDGFGEMSGGNVGSGFEVGNSASYL